METISIDYDIPVFYVTAESFPEGILAAHQKLHAMIPFDPQRGYYGVSRPENDQGIVYRAAARELFDGEGEKLGLETLVLRKGNYTSVILKDFTKDPASISRAFDELLEYPGIDPEGYCVEFYLGPHDVQCMVRLA